MWSSPTLVTTATSRVDDVGGVEPTEQADLDHGDVDRDLGEPPERGGGHDLEPAGVDAGQLLDGGHVADRLGQVVVVDRLAVAGDALVDPLEVRAGVGADGEAVTRPAAR